MEQQKKRWYQKWWGILLMILFWYIAAPIAIYQSKISNTKKIVFASIYLFFVFSFTGMQDNVSTITIGTVTIPSIFLFSEIALLLLIVIALSKNIVYKVKLKKLEEQANKILEVEKMDLIEVKNEKEKIVQEIEELKQNKEKILQEKDELQQEISEITKEIKENKNKLQILNNEVEFVEDYSLYEPRYNFVDSNHYKKQLELIRNKQKAMIREKTAVKVSVNWTVDGSEVKGRKMTNDNVKLLLRNFNAECEAAINRIKYSNLDSTRNRIQNSFEQLNKLNKTNQISITQPYLNLKFDELYLGYRYEEQKQIEKEALREKRDAEREEKILQQEIERKKRNIDKEISHYKNAMEEIRIKMSIANEKEKKNLKKRLEEIQRTIDQYSDEKEELDYRLENIGAGYVYIISNIGAFGENVFKIGVTRRLEPLERIKELSSASVPFKFDVHALIFSYQAYNLEKELHNLFSDKRVNLVNNRKEFFNVNIEEIENALAKYKELTFEFTKIPEAEEYRETLKLKKK